MIFRTAFLLVVITVVSVGCVTNWFNFSSGTDGRVLNIQTFDLFNQRYNSSLKVKPWIGDWIFRRERLALIDNELRSSKPDLLILQEVMSRQGSPSESDENILAAGSLQGYEFESFSVKEYDDTRENEDMLVAVSLPLKIAPFRNPGLRRSWLLGDDGVMTLHLANNEEQDIPIFNVKMPSESEDRSKWYQHIQDQIKSTMQSSGYCPERIIVAGYIPVSGNDQAKYREMMEKLNLKDVAQEACRITTACNTQATMNEIFLATMNDEEQSRVDRILVSNGTYIYSTARAYVGSEPASAYSRAFGLNRMWPSRRFGWSAAVRIPRCKDILP